MGEDSDPKKRLRQEGGGLPGYWNPPQDGSYMTELLRRYLSEKNPPKVLGESPTSLEKFLRALEEKYRPRQLAEKGIHPLDPNSIFGKDSHYPKDPYKNQIFKLTPDKKELRLNEISERPPEDKRIEALTIRLMADNPNLTVEEAERKARAYSLIKDL